MLPMLTTLGVAAVAMGFYNWRITGNLLQMPYMVHEKQYAAAPPFLWQSLPPEPSYLHQQLRDLHLGWELLGYQQQRCFSGLLNGLAAKFRTFFQAYFGLVILQVSLIAFPLLLRHPPMRTVLSILGLFTLALLSETWFHPHYAAPAVGLVLLVTIQSLRYLRTWRWRETERVPPWGINRAQLLAQLRAKPGQHLVVVRYGPNHNPHAEWVYNEASIDEARVVWAREMEPQQNTLLLQYFNDRSPWLLEADAAEPKIVPYTPARD
jgi:hypothetical protein